jgi:hypothetical protein
MHRRYETHGIRPAIFRSFCFSSVVGGNRSEVLSDTDKALASGSIARLLSCGASTEDADKNSLVVLRLGPILLTHIVADADPTKAICYLGFGILANGWDAVTYGLDILFMMGFATPCFAPSVMSPSSQSSHH